jgi:hypothetical protein
MMRSLRYYYYIFLYYVKIPCDQKKKINRVSHDCHGSVDSARLNIAIVKKTYLSPLNSYRET